jgi:hypothetical protein
MATECNVGNDSIICLIEISDCSMPPWRNQRGRPTLHAWKHAPQVQPVVNHGYIYPSSEEKMLFIFYLTRIKTEKAPIEKPTDVCGSSNRPYSN